MSEEEIALTREGKNNVKLELDDLKYVKRKKDATQIKLTFMGLSKELRMLLLVNAVSFIIFIYIGIFVNLYIWELNREIFDVAWFNMVMFIFWGVGFASGGKLLMRYSIRLLCALSALSGGIAFLFLTFLEIEPRVLWIAIIAVPVGLMWGFFSAAQSLSISLVAKGKDISNFYAMINIISQSLSVAVPLLSAWTIIKFGYSSTFLFMLFFIVIILIISYFLPQIALKTIVDVKQEGTLFQNMHWNKVFSAPNSKWAILSCLAAGFFLQFQNLFVLLFTFNITQDKTMIALLSAIYTLVSVEIGRAHV